MVEIGIAGAMGAGKTTLANLLVEQHGYHRLSFADPIRYLTQLLVGRAIDKKHDRPTLQRVGRAGRSPEWQGIDTPLSTAREARTRALAEFIFPEADEARIEALHRALYEEGYSYGWGHPDYWIQRWQRDYSRAPHPVALDDCRFPSEGEFLRRSGFFMVRLDVPLPERQRRIIGRDGHWDPAWTNDPTEIHVNEIPVHLALDGTASPESLAETVYQEALTWFASTRKHPVK